MREGIRQALYALRRAKLDKYASAVEARRTERTQIAELRDIVRRIGRTLTTPLRYETRSDLILSLLYINSALRAHERAAAATGGTP